MTINSGLKLVNSAFNEYKTIIEKKYENLYKTEITESARKDGTRATYEANESLSKHLSSVLKSIPCPETFFEHLTATIKNLPSQVTNFQLEKQLEILKSKSINEHNKILETIKNAKTKLFKALTGKEPREAWAFPSFDFNELTNQTDKQLKANFLRPSNIEKTNEEIFDFLQGYIEAVYKPEAEIGRIIDEFKDDKDFTAEKLNTLKETAVKNINRAYKKLDTLYKNIHKSLKAKLKGSEDSIRLFDKKYETDQEQNAQNYKKIKKILKQAKIITLNAYNVPYYRLYLETRALFKGDCKYAINPGIIRSAIGNNNKEEELFDIINNPDNYAKEKTPKKSIVKAIQLVNKEYQDLKKSTLEQIKKACDNDTSLYNQALAMTNFTNLRPPSILFARLAHYQPNMNTSVIAAKSSAFAKKGPAR